MSEQKKSWNERLAEYEGQKKKVYILDDRIKMLLRYGCDQINRENGKINEAEKELENARQILAELEAKLFVF